MTRYMILFHDVSSFFFLDHPWIECSAAMTTWKNAIDIRFCSSETACDEMDASASRVDLQTGGVVQPHRAQQ